MVGSDGAVKWPPPGLAGEDARGWRLLTQEERLQLALERSMAEHHSPNRRRTPLPAPRADSDPELRRALQASLEEERLRRAALDRSHA